MPNPNATQSAILVAGLLAVAAYVFFIVVPAWVSYGRWWERISAAFLTLYILAALVGVGTMLGFTVVFFYDRYA